MLFILPAAVFALLPLASGHASIWHPSMYGFNVTDKTFPYDNRPVAPLFNMNFSEWWFHNHLSHPPNPGDIFTLPAGERVTTEIACNKGATTYFASSEGGDIRNPASPNDVCPGSPTSEYHTTGIDDVKGCALAIAYKSDANAVQPEDFAVFSVNQTCVWTRFTDFSVPVRMPPCPPGGCTCAWFWIHSPDSGGEQNYMNGFKCNITGSTSTVPIAKPKVPRRCGADPANNKQQLAPANCTYGAKQPFYWFNNEQNNMFEGTFSPPFYTDLYNFLDGPQDDIFADSYASLPSPAPNALLPILADLTPLAGSPTPAVASSTPLVNNTATPIASLAPASATVASNDNGPNATLPTSSPNIVATAIAPPEVAAKTCQRKQFASALSKRSIDGRFSLRSIHKLPRRSRRLQQGKRASLWNIF